MSSEEYTLRNECLQFVMYQQIPQERENFSSVSYELLCRKFSLLLDTHTVNYFYNNIFTNNGCIGYTG